MKKYFCRDGTMVLEPTITNRFEKLEFYQTFSISWKKNSKGIDLNW
jgi:hypothetical protein